MKPVPEQKVLHWLRQHENESCICAVNIEELRFGLLLMPTGKRKFALAEDIEKVIVRFEDSLLPYGKLEAERCADFHALAIREGKTPALGDLMIAAIATTHSLTVATRNVKDFSYLPVKVVNPFED